MLTSQLILFQFCKSLWITLSFPFFYQTSTTKINNMTMNSLSLMLKYHLLPWLIKRLKQESSEFKLSQREFKVS